MALYKAEGIVLRGRNLGEADKILTIFTHERGKVDAVARGVRRPRSRLIGPSQLFTHGTYLLYERKSLDTMNQGDIVRSFRPLREQLHRMAHASYVAELVDRTTELNDRHEALFPLLLAVMELLAAGDELALTTRYFEVQLLKQLGFQLHLTGCVRCGAVRAVFFSSEMGGLVCDGCRGADAAVVRLPLEAIEVLRYLDRAAPTRLGVLQPSLQAMRTLQNILPAFCAARIGRRLYSMEFLLSIGAAEN